MPGILEEERTEEIFETRKTEFSHKLMSDTKTHIQDAPRTPRMRNAPPPKTHLFIIVKLRKILKEARVKVTTSL